MPTHTTITDAAATKFKLPAKDYVDHFDASHPGLALRVRKTRLTGLDVLLQTEEWASGSAADVAWTVPIGRRCRSA